MQTLAQRIKALEKEIKEMEERIKKGQRPKRCKTRRDKSAALLRVLNVVKTLPTVDEQVTRYMGSIDV